MRNFEERKAEVFLRSYQRVKKKKRIRTYMLTCTGAVCLSVFVTIIFVQNWQSIGNFYRGLISPDNQLNNDFSFEYGYGGDGADLFDESDADENSISSQPDNSPDQNVEGDNYNTDAGSEMEQGILGIDGNSYPFESVEEGLENEINDFKNGSTNHPQSSATETNQSQVQIDILFLKDDTSYELSNTDSVAVLNILENLEYDESKVCKCAPEYTFKASTGVSYGVDISEGYARFKNGQAELTPEQVAQLNYYILQAKESAR